MEYQDILNNFIEAMRKNGCEPNDYKDIVADGEDHFFRLKGDRKDKRGGYCLTIAPDGFAHGNFTNFHTSESGSWNSYKNKKGLTPEERVAMQERVKQMEEERKHKEAEKLIKQTEVAKECENIFRKAKKADVDHPYLVRKGIEPHCAKQIGDNLAIWMIADKKIQGIQTIAPDGTKIFPTGGRKKGCYCPLVKKGEDMGTIIICEGFATGASIRECMDLPVMVAFDAGNLKDVAVSISKDYPEATVIIAADNDADTIIKGKQVNIGIEKAQQAAAKIGGAKVIYPPINGDFNDMVKEQGEDAVRTYIKELLETGGGTANTSVQIVSAEDTASTNIATDDDDISWIDKVFWANERQGIYDKKYANHNAILLMTHAEPIKGCLVYDEFCDRVAVVKPMPWDDKVHFEVRHLCEFDIVRMRAYLEANNLPLSKQSCKDAMEVAAQNRSINPAKEYLNSLIWDGVPRLDTWLFDIFGCKYQPKEYLAKVGSCWLKAGVKRMYNAGTPFHHMLVLEGGQAAGKSSALKELATFAGKSYFSDRVTFEHIDRQDFAEFAAGNVILEFQELSGMGKKDRNKIKQWITQAEDEYRRPFASITSKYPRRFILAGTTNETQYLNDPTGDRRFWGIRVGDRVDHAKLRDVKDQLWAEAVYRVNELKEPWYIDIDDPVYKIMQEEQSIRAVEDPWEDMIKTFVDKFEVITTEDIFNEVLKITPDRWDRNLRNRVCDILTRLDMETIVKWHNGKTRRVWVHKNKGFQEEIAWN